MNAKLSGIYKSCWRYPKKSKLYKSITVLLPLSNDSIIGFEICDDKKYKRYGGIYFLKGRVEGDRFKGVWLSLPRHEYGDFTLRSKNDKLEGAYNLRHPTAPDKGKEVNYYYSMEKVGTEPAFLQAK